MPTSYEMSVKLKKAGWTRATNFYYDPEYPKSEYNNFDAFDVLDSYLSAPSLEELLEELPLDTVVYKNSETLENGETVWNCELDKIGFWDKNIPCDAAAKLWIELKGEKNV